MFNYINQALNREDKCLDVKNTPPLSAEIGQKMLLETRFYKTPKYL